MSNALIQKYNVTGSRYTSYPTVPYWNSELFTVDAYYETLQEFYLISNIQKGISRKFTCHFVGAEAL